MQSSRKNLECFDITTRWTEHGEHGEHGAHCTGAKPVGVPHLLHSTSCPARECFYSGTLLLRCHGQNRSEKLLSKTAYYSLNHRSLTGFGFIPLAYFLTFASTCSALSRKKAFSLSPCHIMSPQAIPRTTTLQHFPECARSMSLWPL